MCRSRLAGSNEDSSLTRLFAAAILPAMTVISRREFARRALAVGGAAIVGFDARTRSWLVQGEQASPDLHDLPALDGALLRDETTRTAIAVDGGNMFHRVPIAVLRPGSVADIVTMIKYANRYGLKIATKGDGHSRYGQTQAAGGIVIDTRSLGAITWHGPASIDAQPGAFWGGVALTAWEKSLSPRVLPATCMALTIGGTLAVGGIGRTSHRYGALVDNVTELDVVTGAGKLITCSPSHERELFNMVLAGQGQCGIIARARIPLVPAAKRVALQTLSYDDVDLYLDDQHRCAADGRFHSLFGAATRTPTGAWRYSIEVGTFFDSPTAPDTAARTSGLRFASSTTPVTMSYTDYLFRFEADAGARALGRPAPYIAVWIPAAAAKAFLARIAAIPPGSLGLRKTADGESIAMHPMITSRFTRPLFKVPSVEQAFALWVHRGPPAGDPDALAALLASQRALLSQATAAGGKVYAPYSMVMSPDEWAAHFGPPVWKRLRSAKAEYDPHRTLAPEPAMFG